MPYVFLALACLITWALDVPWVLACLRGETPSETAGLLTGLGALGPTIAAVIVALATKSRPIFGTFRFPWRWLVPSLLLSFGVHQIANVVAVASGETPAQWVLPPVRPEHFVALIFFPVFEELGWRGFAYPRLADRHGPIVASLIVGVVWAVWHLGMMFTPEGGAPDAAKVLFYVAMLAPWSVVMAWVLERAGRSTTIAIAIHAGAHLDNVTRGTPTVQWAYVGVGIVLATVAAWRLRTR